MSPKMVFQCIICFFCRSRHQETFNKIKFSFIRGLRKNWFEQSSVMFQSLISLRSWASFFRVPRENEPRGDGLAESVKLSEQDF